MKLNEFVIKLMQDVYDFEAYWKISGNKKPEDFHNEMSKEEWYEKFDRWTFE